MKTKFEIFKYWTILILKKWWQVILLFSLSLLINPKEIPLDILITLIFWTILVSFHHLLLTILGLKADVAIFEKVTIKGLNRIISIRKKEK